MFLIRSSDHRSPLINNWGMQYWSDHVLKRHTHTHTNLFNLNIKMIYGKGIQVIERVDKITRILHGFKASKSCNRTANAVRKKLNTQTVQEKDTFFFFSNLYMYICLVHEYANKENNIHGHTSAGRWCMLLEYCFQLICCCLIVLYDRYLGHICRLTW